MPLIYRFGTLRYLTRYHEAEMDRCATCGRGHLAMRDERKVDLVQVALEEECRRGALLIQVSLKESAA